MRSARFSALACLALLSGACSGPTSSETVNATGSPVILGLPSTAEEDFVVHLRVAGVGVCTATLIAPNAVITALHCVSQFDANNTYTCNNDGTVAPIMPGGGVYDGPLDATRVEVRVGPAPTLDEPSAYGERIFGSGSTTVCKDDIAVVVLDRSLDLPPQYVRLGKPTARGSLLTFVGYGQTETASGGLRNRRTDMAVVAVGAFGPYGAQGVAVPNSFKANQGPCHGDSGGPTFDQETFAVTGVSSLLQSNDCNASVQNTFTQVGPFEDLVREALDYAGFEPLVESDGSGEGGAGAEGGTGGTDPGSAGEAQGGEASQAGGAPGTGGSEVSMAGSDSGEGGAGATSPGTGGTEASGGSTSPAGRTGNAGTTTAPGVGSGSRNDATCACRLEATAPNRGLGWVGLLSLFTLAYLRRGAR
jgi:hypothetical protein